MPESELSPFVVTKEATRPAGTPTECFCCHSPVGGFHRSNCVLVERKIKLRAYISIGNEVVTVVLEDNAPASWEKWDIEFKYNESSFCLNTIGDKLYEKIPDRLKPAIDAFLDKTCFCDNTECEFLGYTSEPFCSE